MTLKEQTFQDIVSYIETRKNELLELRLTDYKHENEINARIVEIMMIESLILRKFAAYNKKLVNDNL